MSIPTYRSGWDHVYNAPETQNNGQLRNDQSSQNPSQNNNSQWISRTDNLPSNPPDQIFQNQQQIAQPQENNATLYQYSVVEENTLFVQQQTAWQILLSEIHLLRIAGEITEVEEAELMQLASQKYEQVKEAIRQHSQ